MRAGSFALLLALGGCDDHTFPPIVEGGETAYSPDWAGVERFLGDQCQSCHPALSPPSLPGGIVDDVLDGTNRYVVPFEPDQSELWLVLNDASEVSPIMPQQVNEPLPEEVIGPIREWILDGATFN